MSLTPLTKQQRLVLDFIDTFVQQRGYAPSLEEICKAFNLSSLATVHKHLTNLQAKGYIKRAYNRSRSVEILSNGPRCPHCGQAMPSSRVPDNPEVVPATVDA